MFFDHEINSEKALNYLENFQGRNYIFSRVFWNREKNPFSIGTGIVWLPSLVVLSVFFKDRFNLVFELGPGITGIFLMLGGLYFLEKYLQNFFSRKISELTILSVFFTTNVIYYTAFEPALSHQPSFFLISFLLFWTYKFKKKATNFLILGFLCGTLTSIRIADTILLIPILYQAKPQLSDLKFLILGYFFGILPQLLVQNIVYGNFLINPYLNGQNGAWRFNLSRLYEHLFSQKRGLFLWSPFLLVGLLGLTKMKKFVVIFSIIFLWIVSSSWSAYLSAGYGQRFSFAAIPYFSLGISYFLSKISPRKTVIFVLPFLAWNFLLLKNFYLHKDLFVINNSFTFSEFIKYMFSIS